MNQALNSNNFNMIRLVAALQVTIVHSLNHFDVQGFLVGLLKATPGVPMFFIISGFLIGSSYLRNHKRGLRPFYTNRMLRIYPGLIVCVVLTTCFVAATGYFGIQGISVLQIFPWMIGQVSFIQFYNPDFMRSFGVGVLNGALWTITVELQFYLLMPVLFKLLIRRKVVFTLLLAASIGTNLWVHHVAAPEAISTKLLRISFLPWIYMFMVGFLLAWRADWMNKLLRIGWLPLLFGYVAALIVIGDYEVNAQNSINPVAFLFLGVLVLKLAYSNLCLPTRFQKFIQRTDISYGLYLYHMPIINLLLYLGVSSVIFSTSIALLASLGAAALSWYLVERPVLNYKN